MTDAEREVIRAQVEILQVAINVAYSSGTPRAAVAAMQHVHEALVEVIGG